MEIETERIKILNDKKEARGNYVLYWMQQSQRVSFNHALNYAAGQANNLKLPLLVVFGLTAAYPEANQRHYTFMLEGLQKTQRSLAKMGIAMVIRQGEPPEVALSLAAKASLVVCDRGYLRHQRTWRSIVAKKAPCQVVQVESDVVVPLETVSAKAEYAARTIRPKINRQLATWLKPLPKPRVKIDASALAIKGIDIGDIATVLKPMAIDASVAPVSRFYQGGSSQAYKHLDTFIRHGLAQYDKHSNQPQTDDISHMSPYLHFGQISPLEIALKISKTCKGRQAACDSYLEELIVRRELAINFVYYTPDYDTFGCLPQWARTTLREHQDDQRETLYSPKQLAAASTHDEYWNAAMREMRTTGFMHNYMRMYWGKKVLQWSADPATAFDTLLNLNNRYFLDGRDPNSYTGVAWIFGLHDRAWAERPIFGKVRYMAASGLERKCDIRAYVAKVDRLMARSRLSAPR
jgi:deoxyribodipyrimidine photo-lyase